MPKPSQIGEFFNEVRLGHVRFNKDVCISDISNPDILVRFKKLFDSHYSIVVNDPSSVEHSIFRVFTSQFQKNWYHTGHSGHTKFISKIISDHNILTFKQPQYLVTNPVYKVRKDLISVIDDGNGDFLVDFFEKNREKILEAIQSTDSVRLVEFLEKIN